jgi:hypothetical protein
MADLDEIMESRPQGTEEQTTRDDGRDDRGRFAGQAREQAKQDAETQAQREQPAPVEQPDPAKPPAGFIPQQAFDARMAKAEEKFNERYAALEARLNQQNQPRPQPVERKAPPDFFENPDAAFQARLQEALSPIIESQTRTVENFSRTIAVRDHGQQAVDQAFQDLKSRVGANPTGMQATYAQIMQSPHPYDELVRWHKKEAALSTYGDDPEAWRTSEREKMKAELLAEMQGGQPQVQQAQQAMPSNFAGSRSNGPRSTASFSGPMPLSEIMGGR